MKNSFIFKVYNFYYKKIGLTFFRNKIWIILSGIAFLFSLFRIFASKFMDKTAFFVFFMSCILYFSALLIVFTSHNSGSWRYVYPTEFIYFVTAAFLPYFINFKKNIFKFKIKSHA